MTRGRKRHWGRLEQDLVIHLVLSQGDQIPVEVQAPAGFDRSSKPGGVFLHDELLGEILVPRFKSVSAAARWLEGLWATDGFHCSWKSIQARYNLLKKADGENVPDYVKKRL